ncbi:hypothetical protein D5086_016675 [Populus alba]|uniref:Uncharacterized protein n=1 Tax=Populus alba TaxID=43335 RepID=A0ACC4BUM0_POPAL
MHGVFHSKGSSIFCCVSMGWKLVPPWLDGRSWIFGIDRLCTGLRASLAYKNRLYKVSLIGDISQKRSMKLRLLHGVVFSEPWFGLWGYKIGYQTLSDHSLVTLGNLSRFMLDLETHLPAENCIDSYNMEPTCRQDVGDAARVHIDDTDDQINVYPEQQGFGHQPFKNEGWTQDDKASTNEGRAMLVQKYSQKPKTNTEPRDS